jgi:hypothetical protein
MERGGPGPDGQPLRGLRRGAPADSLRAGRRDPEMDELVDQERSLVRETMDLVREYRKASKKDEKLKERIEGLVASQFDVRQQRRKLELSRLEGELRRLQEAFERRDKASKQIIEKRVTELLGQEEDVGF